MLSRKEAIANGEEFYFGSLCSNGHDVGNGKSKRYTIHKGCVSCISNRSTSWKSRNRVVYLENTKKYNIRWRSKNPKRYLLNSARQRSVEKNLIFSITEADFEIPEFCPLKPDLRLNLSFHGYSPASPSLDRKDPRMGYVPGNVWVISSLSNTQKSNNTLARHNEINEIWNRLAREDPYLSGEAFNVEGVNDIAT